MKIIKLTDLISEIKGNKNISQKAILRVVRALPKVIAIMLLKKEEVKFTAFFKLGFLDKNSVALGRQLKELIPILWMKAGSYGACPELDEDNKNMVVYPDNHFAVLINERHFTEFEEIVNQHPEIDTLFFVTDSDAGYREMISGYQNLTTVHLYKDYLDNFRINTGR